MTSFVELLLEALAESEAEDAAEDAEEPPAAEEPARLSAARLAPLSWNRAMDSRVDRRSR